jgi:hypothetical protein
MFQGSKETQQAAAQTLLEVVTYLTRARQSLLAVAPLFKDPRESDFAQKTRMELKEMTEFYELRYASVASDAFKEEK